MRLGLTPDAFWALSTAEWGALCRALVAARPEPMTRDDLTELMEIA